MKVLLSINHEDFLLPDDKNLTAMLKTLSRAIRVTDRTWEEDPHFQFIGEAKIEVKMIPGNVRIRGLKKEPKEKPLALNEPNSILL